MKRKVILLCLSVMMILAGIYTVYSIMQPHGYAFPDDAKGYWYAPGYGAIIEIDNGIDYYEETDVSLIQSKLPLLDLPGFYFEMYSENTAKIGVVGTSWNYEIVRINSLPEDKLYTHNTDDYKTNFEVLWHTFDELYAFFDERNVDWNNIYETYHDKAAMCRTDDEFYQLITEVLDVFNDNHIMLYTSHKDAGWHDGDSVDIDWLNIKTIDNTLQEIIESNKLFYFPKKTAGKILEDGIWSKYISVIKEKYLSNEFISCCNDIIFYGVIDENTGYICVLKEDYLTSNKGDIPSEGLRLLNKELDNMANYFSNVDNIIIDARFNWGGTDSYSKAIASRFAKENDIAFYQSAHYEGREVNKQTFYYDALKGVAFSAKNIYVLSSSVTLSAGECLVMYLGNLPNVCIVGESTMGVWSNTLVRTLPNGWEFTLSNESVFDPQSICYEAVGYPPDVYVSFNSSLFDEDIDSILEKAIELSRDK